MAGRMRYVGKYPGTSGRWVRKKSIAWILIQFAVQVAFALRNR